MSYEYGVANGEINNLRVQYINGDMEVEEFEDLVGFWLKWDTLSPIEKREFEMFWFGSKQLNGTPRVFKQNSS